RLAWVSAPKRSIDQGFPKGGSPRNRDKRLTRAGAVLRWAKKKRLINDDFAELFRYPGKIEQNSYAAFDACDLKALFESESYKNGTFKTPSEYWLPILALHTGARLNELCQLSVTDIGTHDGVETISILAREEGKRLKNKASERIIPIHSKLIELGFLDYVRTIKAGRLFPELPEDPARPGNFGAKATEQFTAYRRKCGVGALSGKGNKSIHSFRSTFISALRKAGVPKDRRTRLAGHEYDDTQDKTYHGGDVLTMFDFKTLKADIEQVRFEVEFTAFETALK
ncbi:MAG TPA: site-specific integrase, partial [Promineifilum sp.]|uniref:site-specific integrase n=1 Tax=Thauera sp. TaxID=1905334 RepID=UPI002D0AC9AF